MNSSTKIANHELYTVDTVGNIYSGKLDINLKPNVQANGYLTVTLDNQSVLIHRLVAKHFIPNPYGYKQVNHKNGIKSDNRVVNLEWCSAEQNIQHALVTGLRSGYIHVDIKRSMLKRALVGESVGDLALEVGNHPNTLSRMLRVQAKKDGLAEEWSQTMKLRRKEAAIRNLEIINASD